MSNYLRSGLIVFIAAALSASASASILVDYNTAGDLVANFNLNHNGAGNKYLETPAVGLGGTQGITSLAATDQAHTSAVYKLSSLDLSSTGSTVTVSHFFRRQNGTNLITNFSTPQIGVLTDNTEFFGTNTLNTSYASLRLLSSTSSFTDVFLQTEAKSGTGTRQSGAIPGTATLTAGNWYKLWTTIENVSATQVRITGALEDWGASGAGLVSTVLQALNTDPGSLINFAGTDLVLGDSSVWPGWRSFAEGGAAVMDNFAATPEPASLTLLVLGSLVLINRRR